MISIRFRIILLLGITSLGICASGYLTWEAFQSYHNVFSNYVLSHEIEEATVTLRADQFSKQISERLQIQRAKVTPAHRTEALSNVIQAYNDKYPALLKKRVIFLKAVEQEYRKFLLPQVRFLREKIIYYGTLCLASILLSLFLTLLYVQKSVFKPLHGLSRKMVDFLNQKYTYQFSIPEPNEVGNLQGTFNALAQKVLSNMDELKALDKAKSDFLSIASHELRTPLTSIKGSLALMKSGIVGPLNKAADNLMQIALSETDRLIRLINDLLDLAKIDAKRFPLQHRWAALRPMVEATFRGLEGLATAAEVQLRMEEIPPVEVLVDPDRVQQVLTNLLSNAIKYSPKNQPVSVSVETNQAGDLVVEVTDHGKGIDPEDQNLIFQKFRQATSAKNPLVKGTGLGLAIAKALVEEHQGRIGVRSTIDQGSTFYFTLPQWRFSRAAQETPESSGESEGGIAA